MFPTTRKIAMTAVTVAVGIIACSAPAEPPSMPMSTDAPAHVRAGVDFRSCHWLSDREVFNDKGDKIASVSDLILERGSGTINYLVVKTGTILGLRGKTVAIPYGAFHWDAKDENFILASTEDQLKAYPEFSAKDWSAMMESKAEDVNELRDKFGNDPAFHTDPYSGSLDTSKRMKFEGEVTDVDRVRTSMFGEYVVITVADTKGNSQKVSLGPSWYVNGGAWTPMRGDKVVVESLALPRESEQLTAATEVRSGKNELHLRDSDGSPAWTLQSARSGGRNYHMPYWRYLLLSNVRGMKVDCRGNDCGKVNDVIIDRRSGEVGFLSIDPNKNFLGIADTKRLVPWTVCTVALDGTVRIDASKDMVLASPETPSDLSTLNNPATAAMAYNAYQVKAPKFEPVKPVAPAPPNTADAWNAHGPIITSIDRNSMTTLSGKITDVTEVKFDGGIQPAKALKIKTADGDDVVLLGPAWYLDKQHLAIKKGDTVTVDACRTNINGKTYWLADAVDCNGTKVVLLNSNHVPAWDRNDR